MAIDKVRVVRAAEYVFHANAHFQQDTANSLWESAIHRARKALVPVAVAFLIVAAGGATVRDARLCSQIRSEPETQPLLKAYDAVARKNHSSSHPFRDRFVNTSADGRSMWVFSCPNLK